MAEISLSSETKAISSRETNACLVIREANAAIDTIRTPTMDHSSKGIFLFAKITVSKALKWKYKAEIWEWSMRQAKWIYRAET